MDEEELLEDEFNLSLFEISQAHKNKVKDNKRYFFILPPHLIFD